jgi:hypothetical protein
MKMSWDNFERRVIELHMSWKLSIRAIEGFKESGEALGSYLTEDYQDFIGLLSKVAKTSGKQIIDFPAYQTFDKFKPRRSEILHRELDSVIRNIHAAYLVNFVAILEDHIKQCARVLLSDNPQILGSQRQIPLGKLISMGKDEVILQEVERCVQSLDRKSIEERVDFFKKNFGLDFFEEPGKNLLKSLSDKRNRLLHEDPGTGASKIDVDLSFFLCFSIGTWLLMQIDTIAPDLIDDKEKHSFRQREKLLQAFPPLRAYKDQRNSV